MTLPSIAVQEQSLLFLKKEFCGVWENIKNQTDEGNLLQLLEIGKKIQRLNKLVANRKLLKTLFAQVVN